MDVKICTFLASQIFLLVLTIATQNHDLQKNINVTLYYLIVLQISVFVGV
jgi:hypothetical protein